ncbi:lipid IV(A) 3-deoxy-D-manno-octulosonic acid transferase [Psychromonas sp. MME2]|uniref:lipid IV(A) 3-deoxy-D-manno-octulosonic acid transferase n=1 Tax=unclassified Psychromonas TaxID=2614957 RepID=UPI00339C833D
MLIRLLYTLLITLAAPFFLYGLYKKKPNKPAFAERWVEHFGFTPKLNDPNGKPIWIHTVSVGEAIAATPFIKTLKAKHPNTPIVVTTTTSTGAAEIAKLAPLIEHRYMPLDLPFAVKGFLKAIRPMKLIIMETELWPNTLHYAAKSGIPITIINARLSQRSCSRYQKFQAVFDLLSSNIKTILCQTKDDAQRFAQLGVAQEKIHVTGSIKFDIEITDAIKQRGMDLRKELATTRPVWIAASTHHGEDEKIVAAHKQLLELIPNALLIIVPRHPERFDAVYFMCQAQHLKVARRSHKEPIDVDTQVYLGDTMGEMLTLIGAADICFMAGSLLGNAVGGHNVLEPAALAKPILIGPSYFNFQQISEQLIALGACTVCHDSSEISTQLLTLFNAPDIRKTQGNNALALVNKSKGAVQRTLSYFL